MTKDQLQKELKEKVKEGVKPSDIRKLKRSKSAGDIPSPLPTITQLQEQVKFHAQTAANYLKSLQTSQARVNELETQLKQPTELDQSLLKRHQNLKSWFTQYQKSKQLDKELTQNIDEASQELINQDKTISTLRTQLSTLKRTNQSLQKDLGLANKLANYRKVPFLPSETNWDYLKYALYSLALVLFTYFLLKVKHG